MRGLVDPGVLFIGYAEYGSRWDIRDPDDHIPPDYWLIDPRDGPVVASGQLQPCGGVIADDSTDHACFCALYNSAIVASGCDREPAAVAFVAQVACRAIGEATAPTRCPAHEYSGVRAGRGCRSGA
jgi:hypothetical protein